MTDFLATSLNAGHLTLYLLTSANSHQPDIALREDESAPLLQNVSATDRPDGQSTYKAVFHDLHSQLLYAFHDHWMYLSRDEIAPRERPTVMSFEKIFKLWREETLRWLQRGKVAGWWDDRGFLTLSHQQRHFLDQRSLGTSAVQKS